MHANPHTYAHTLPCMSVTLQTFLQLTTQGNIINLLAKIQSQSTRHS